MRKSFVNSSFYVSGGFVVACSIFVSDFSIESGNC